MAKKNKIAGKKQPKPLGRTRTKVRRIAPAINLEPPVIPETRNPVVSFITHFVKPEIAPIPESKYDYLSLYNKVRRLPFSVGTELSLIVSGSYSESIKKSALSILKYFIDSDIFKPHQLEFSSDYTKVRTVCDKNYGGNSIIESWKYKY